MAVMNRIFTSSASKSKIVLILGVILCFAKISHAVEYETINSPSNSASSASAQYSTSNSNSRTLGGGNYYNEPKSSQYADYYPSYSYGNALKRDSDSYAAPTSSYGMTGEEKGDEDSGLYGLIGLLGLLGLVPALLPILGPLLGLLLLLLLPILLPIIGPLLLPLLLILALPLLILFLPVPVVTVPGTGRGSTTSSGVMGRLDMETARMIYDAIGRDECIERYTCEVAHRARSFGINTEKIYGFFLGKKQLPTSPKWMHSIARGFKHNDDCKSYTCSSKLF